MFWFALVLVLLLGAAAWFWHEDKRGALCLWGAAGVVVIGRFL